MACPVVGIRDQHYVNTVSASKSCKLEWLRVRGNGHPVQPRRTQRLVACVKYFALATVQSVVDSGLQAYLAIDWQRAPRQVASEVTSCPNKRPGSRVWRILHRHARHCSAAPTKAARSLTQSFLRT